MIGRNGRLCQTQYGLQIENNIYNLAWNNVLERGVIFKLYNFGIPLQQSAIYPIGQLR